MEPIEHSEMFTRLSRYFAGGPNVVKKASKKAKKMIENLKADVGTDAYPTFDTLAESIAFKRDASKSNWATYDPKKVERDWNKWWVEEKYYSMSPEEAATVPEEQRFTIAWPPSNVTGYLHIGHAFTAAIEDGLSRWNRMSGKKVLFVPGVDHAGIATQAVVEKRLFQEQGIKKADIGREKFVAEVYKWKDHSCEKIKQQLQSMGVSTDWDRFIFTMDEPRNEAVNEAFARLYEMGVIYRANRLVHWSCSLRTAISDLEVEMEDIPKPTKMQVPGHSSYYEFGVLIHFAYKTKEGNEEIVVATTRIETMLGDTAVAVHPEDPRYKHLIGKELVHPFVPNRVIKVIGDSVLVDMNFGTGAVKVTPAHDPNDFLCGERNNLEFINILNDNGTINENGGKYKDMLRYDVRVQIVKDLTELGLFRDKTPNPMKLGICQRSGDVVEPVVKPQWYIRMTPDLKEHMLSSVKSKALHIIPEVYENTWNGWINNLEDWCISRQLWWGHRIPAYLVKNKSDPTHIPNPNDGKDWIIGRDLEEATKQAEAKYKTDRSNLELTQDEDVLDTWFSSALYPFSIFGWPHKTKDLETFYPNTILETGADIIFFWVARMVIMGYYLTDKQLPYKKVFLHNIVRDSNGEKMSKSKGNVIDPLEIIDGCTLDVILNKINQSSLSDKEKKASIEKKKKEFPLGIPECGSDALRFGLLNFVHHGKDINLDLELLISHRQFCNKIWNSIRFVLSSIAPDFKYDITSLKTEELTLADKWVLTKLQDATKAINENFAGYYFSEATTEFQRFWVNTFCDVYMEYSKLALKDATKVHTTSTILFHIVETGLRLLHPLMIYLSEELYQKLPNWQGKSNTVSLAPYPQHNPAFVFEGVDSFQSILDVVTDIRRIIGKMNLPAKSEPLVFVSVAGDEPKLSGYLATYLHAISVQAKSGPVAIIKAADPAPKGCASVLSSKVLTVHVEVSKFINVNDEIKKIEKQIAEKQKSIDANTTRMGKPEYAKVPDNVKAQDKEKMALLEAEISTLRASIDTLKQVSV